MRSSGRCSCTMLAWVLLMVTTSPHIKAQDNVPTWSCVDEVEKHVIWSCEHGVCVTPPVLHGDRVLVGTRTPYRASQELGLLLCLDSNDGQVIWQASHPKLPARANDMLGACGKPIIAGRRVYYQSNRGELMCVDIAGFGNGNDGPYRDEPATGMNDADIVWKLDMIEQLGIFKRDAGDVANPLPCPLVVGDMVYCVTGNGGKFDSIPKPDAPSFIAVDKLTGAVLWSSNAPGKEICHGQWSSPVTAKIDGEQVIIFPGGDGRLYGFEPLHGKPLWSVDCNDADAQSWRVPRLDSNRKGLRNFFVATPTVVDTMLFVGTSHEYEFRGGQKWPVFAIDLQKAHRKENAIHWKYAKEQFGGTFGSVAADGELLYVWDYDGYLIALDRSSGRELWRADTVEGAGYFASPTVHQGKVFVGTEEGHLCIYSTGRTKQFLGRFDFGEPVSGDPVFAGDRMYITTIRATWAVRMPGELLVH